MKKQKVTPKPQPRRDEQVEAQTSLEDYMRVVRSLNQRLDQPINHNRGIVVRNVGRGDLAATVGTITHPLSPDARITLGPASMPAPAPERERASLPTFASRLIHATLENRAKEAGSVEIDTTDVDPRLPNGLIVLLASADGDSWKATEISGAIRVPLLPGAVLLVMGIGFSISPHVLSNLQRPI